MGEWANLDLVLQRYSKCHTLAGTLQIIHTYFKKNKPKTIFYAGILLM